MVKRKENCWKKRRRREKNNEGEIGKIRLMWRDG